MKAGIALLVSLSGRRHSWLTEMSRLRKGSGTYKRGELFLQAFQYQDRLIKHIEENPDFIQPVSRQNEMLNNFLRPGLEDFACPEPPLTGNTGVL